jgi:ribosomal protein S18 acetylase RimI-like enzyme
MPNLETLPEFSLPEPLTCRLAQDGDLEFLRRVYFGTRWAELEVTGWSDARKLEFLTMQFDMQDVHYRAHYPGAEFLIVLEGNLSVGRLYLYRVNDELRVMDIALLPEHRGRGIGATLMQTLLEAARGAGIRVTLHVEHQNPARGWYERLGFVPLEDRGVYLLMGWSP